MLGDIAKVLQPSAEETSGTLKKATDADGATFEDFVAPITDKDQLAYDRVKQVLMRKKGYAAPDFEEGGPLYGKAVNELIELAREK
jgi:hypothetical protein